jgi:uncharacterized membrane protein
MPRSLAAGAPAAVAIAILGALAGCKRAPEEPAATPAPQSSAASPTAGTPSGEAPPVEDPGSDATLLALVWNCDDGQTRRMRNLLREDAITIEMHEGGRKLPRVAGASGAKYSDGSLAFWTKGDTAILERAGAPPVNCRQDRYASLLADARIRGVLLRGTGNEPGWTLEIGPGTRLEFVTNYGQARYAFAASTERAGAQAGARVFTAQDGERSLEVTVAAQTCADDMSGQVFDHRMVVAHDGQTYRGCAAAVR